LNLWVKPYTVEIYV